MSQLGCMDSRNKLQRQKKGPWSLRESQAKKMFLGEGGGEAWACSRERERESVCEYMLEFSS